ncbi:MAG: response regulator transcription factor [Dehalococcoidales bacterium]|nr:response regulator transcription factor [Dehalococcoidales bacterium]
MITKEPGEPVELESGLIQNGFTCSGISYKDVELDQVPRQTPDVIILEVTDNLPSLTTWHLINWFKHKISLPVIAIVDKKYLYNINNLRIDDFIVTPFDINELVARIKRLLQRVKNMESGDVIKCDGLLIDLVKCEVTLENQIIELTFKEYELLRYLASNQGRVFSREALLDKVWGYDYFGGDRTVDVHIRRLRSKIEDADHTFIETVRNIGYRFKKNT